ncbi:glutamate ABC transporter substrate-binding protein [Nocardia sp. NEAU-G5]|uniref:Glutamate ABC transporter substrate-binding protein n=1 Tax=Nocardia albiluteola TaxID=2842303 RepID=A0ABS6B6Y2_9NOCA|nr:glutamate ABC transporter substrate-binding protein [Nocardia albiluteola]MBU3066081.1 glutamate ABC transporter substrate-binding protein [Nocardia albiluteola]
MSTRRFRHGVALALTATALLSAGCAATTSAPRDDSTASYIEPPLPASAAPLPTNSPLPPAAAEQSCGDVTASLSPNGTTQGTSIDAIRARGRLLVGLDPGSNLFSFRDPISGTLEGFDVDIAGEIARDLFGDPQRVEYRILSQTDRERALREHTVDVVLETMTINCQRKQHVAFSVPYFMAHQRILVTKNSGINGLADLAGKRMCMVKGTTSLDFIRRAQPKANILTAPTWADCLVILQQRQADAASTDNALLAGLAAQDPYYVELVGPDLTDEPYGVGIPPGQDDMVRFVNGTLARIRSDGTWNRLYQRWLQPALGPSSGPPQPEYQG